MPASIGSRLRHILIATACGLLLSPANAGESDTPLLDSAATLSYASMPQEEALRERLAQAARALEQNPPPEENCARTLGAARFSELLDTLGAAQAALGDHEAAADAFERSIACSPRAPYLHAELARALMNLGRHEEARAAARRALDIEPGHPGATSIIARLDFIEERWPDAIERLGTVALSDEDPVRATYWMCLHWIAQMRSGVREPVTIDREPVEDWPLPILELLRGERSEQELLETLQEENTEPRRRELLTEALFYVGQQRLASGDAETARRYFAAAVNLKVLYFVEHQMALAELAKLR